MLPDGCAEIVVNLGESRQFALFRNQRQVLPKVSFVGICTEPVLLKLTPPYEILGLRLDTALAGSVVGERMQRVRNRIVDRTDLLDLMTLRDASRLNVNDKCEMIQSRLASRLRPAHHFPVHQVIKLLRQSNGQQSARTLISNAGWPERSVRRWFNINIGISPQMLCRILRFRNALSQLRRETRSMAWVAVNSGFCDQPHMVREFRQFSNLPPSRLLAETRPIINAFTSA